MVVILRGDIEIAWRAKQVNTIPGRRRKSLYSVMIG